MVEALPEALAGGGLVTGIIDDVGELVPLSLWREIPERPPDRNSTQHDRTDFQTLRSAQPQDPYSAAAIAHPGSDMLNAAPSQLGPVAPQQPL